MGLWKEWALNLDIERYGVTCKECNGRGGYCYKCDGNGWVFSQEYEDIIEKRESDWYEE